MGGFGGFRGGFSRGDADDIFKNFFGGRDPFEDFFNDDFMMGGGFGGQRQQQNNGG